MNPRRRATAIAVVGTAVGATGLGVLAAPAGAGTEPDLPPVEAQALVESVLRADVPALSGTVGLDNGLDLAALPGLSALNSESARVFHDGEGHSRVALERERGELTAVLGEDALWTYDSGAESATRVDVPRGEHHRSPGAGREAADPTALARQFVAGARENSTVSVDGTATVADRPAYELVLTPRPDERTLLREVRVAVDEQTRMPLRLSVFTHGTTEPALEVGFDELDLGAQPAHLFEFEPPEGVDVESVDPGEKGARPDTEGHGSGNRPVETVGDGWDTVLLTRIPEDALRQGSDAGGPTGMGSPRDLLRQVGERVTGPYGSGHLITTGAVTALVTDDGRVAVGAVPEPVLTEALGTR
ncbi:LolA family protein [Saccharomonospora iraqiensis]|uniref:LolA family protein n=1 Tax=Saccharomonospora iraqiensis TaxID=52698 RepID=UPI00022E0B43|nr:hypothetical protein [Saccharomonospora iraqiensis]